MLAGGEPYGNKLDPLAVAAKHERSTPEAAGRFLLELFLQGDVADSVAKTLFQIATADEEELRQRLRQMVRGIVTLPEYQLM